MYCIGCSGTWTSWRLYLKHESGNKLSSHIDMQSSMQLQGYHLYSEELGNVAAITPLSDNYVAMVAPRLRRSGLLSFRASETDTDCGIRSRGC